MARERLDKLLGHLGFGSRRELKGLIRDGRVAVDGVTVRDPGMLVDPQAVRITVDGEAVAYRRHFHVLLHKPAGVITATTDAREQTVLDLVPQELRHRGLFPVGRLDRDTEGLLLLTTDGELGHRLLSPRYHVAKRYWAEVDGPLTASDVAAFAEGVRLNDGYVTMPARLEIAGPQAGIVTLQEGKYHQVKRMFAACGKQVVYLKRLSMGPLELGDLPCGEARPLTEAEAMALYAAVGLSTVSDFVTPNSSVILSPSLW